MLKTEADLLELVRADLAMQLEDDLAKLAKSEAIRSNVRSLDEVKQLSSLPIWKQWSGTLSQNLDHL
jgi:DNA-binding TFAR19-related protein (PDSD5 family)